MFVTLTVKDRPKHGINAFSPEEEAEIYRLVTMERARYEDLASHLHVSLYTIRNIVKRQRIKGAA